MQFPVQFATEGWFYVHAEHFFKSFNSWYKGYNYEMLIEILHFSNKSINIIMNCCYKKNPTWVVKLAIKNDIQQKFSKSRGISNEMR